MKYCILLILPICIGACLTTQGCTSKNILPVEKIKGIGDSQQVIIVSAKDDDASTATADAYEKKNGKWEKAFGPMDAAVGTHGMNKQKEGDLKSPSGIFEIGTTFGTEDKPEGVKMPYKKTTDYDYWVDDSSSPDYNKWVYYEGDASDKWKSCENLRITAYKYAAVIDYNAECIPGKGSAIFLHVRSGPGNSTAGCTALDEEDVLKLIKWFDPDKNPVIVQGSETFLQSLEK